MTTPFGPQLVGETEKTLTALLRRFLAETGLSESQWVTLRVAQLYGVDDTEGLAAAVADRAHFPDASDLVGSLTDRGLLEAGRLTPAGRDVISTVLATSERETGGIWRDHPAADIEATTRVLNDVLARARVLLDSRAGTFFTRDMARPPSPASSPPPPPPGQAPAGGTTPCSTPRWRSSTWVSPRPGPISAPSGPPA